METLKLCVSCKACRRECPTGVDMAKMKIEVLAARAAKHGLSLRDRFVAYLPHYAPIASTPRAACQSAQPQPAAARAVRAGHAGSARGATLPRMAPGRVPARRKAPSGRRAAGRSSCSPIRSTANSSARIWMPRCAVLTAAGYRVHLPQPADGGRRPLCCGRTFLSAGLVAKARAELDRTVSALMPFVERGVPVIGLEPSCLLTFRDEMLSLRKDAEAPQARGAGFPVRGVSRAPRRRMAGSACRSHRSPARRSSTAIAIRKRSPR